ncbi:Fanconi anemia group D2 protein-like [Schistocerca gregaria]|uniref:Fanconi anemia group D2 protein-like n=1 Tax=Schistocerca gregaria TaxID=7010 RepID=UPI00211DF180|nr:Fanconi anemia group D2 protein-like [Schistocerca gregaria]
MSESLFSLLFELIREPSNDLMPALLDTISNLNFQGQHLAQFHELATDLLDLVEAERVPVVIKFLLHTAPADSMHLLVRRIRKNLNVESLVAENDPSRMENITVIVECFKAGMRVRRDFVHAFVHAFCNSTSPSNHSVLDIWLVLIACSVEPELRSKLELTLREKISSRHIETTLLARSVANYGVPLEDFVSILSRWVHALLCHGSADSSSLLQSAATELGLAFFRAFSADAHRRQFLLHLSSLAGSEHPGQTDAALSVLSSIIEKFDAETHPHAHSILSGILDHLDSTNLASGQIFAIYSTAARLVCQSPESFDGPQILNHLKVLLQKQTLHPELRYRLTGAIGCAALTSVLGAQTIHPQQLGPANEACAYFINAGFQLEPPAACCLWADALSQQILDSLHQQNHASTSSLRPPVAQLLFEESRRFITLYVEASRAGPPNSTLCTWFDMESFLSTSVYRDALDGLQKEGGSYRADDYSELERKTVLNFHPDVLLSFDRASQLQKLCSMMRISCLSERICTNQPGLLPLLLSRPSLSLFPKPSTCTPKSVHAHFDGMSAERRDAVAGCLIYAASWVREAINLLTLNSFFRPQKFFSNVIELEKKAAQIYLQILVQLETWLDHVLESTAEYPAYRSACHPLIVPENSALSANYLSPSAPLAQKEKRAGRSSTLFSSNAAQTVDLDFCIAHYRRNLLCPPVKLRLRPLDCHALLLLSYSQFPTPAQIDNQALYLLLQDLDHKLSRPPAAPHQASTDLSPLLQTGSSASLKLPIMSLYAHLQFLVHQLRVTVATTTPLALLARIDDIGVPHARPVSPLLLDACIELILLIFSKVFDPSRLRSPTNQTPSFLALHLALSITKIENPQSAHQVLANCFDELSEFTVPPLRTFSCNLTLLELLNHTTHYFSSHPSLFLDRRNRLFEISQSFLKKPHTEKTSSTHQLSPKTPSLPPQKLIRLLNLYIQTSPDKLSIIHSVIDHINHLVTPLPGFSADSYPTLTHHTLIHYYRALSRQLAALISHLPSPPDASSHPIDVLSKSLQLYADLLSPAIRLEKDQKYRIVALKTGRVVIDAFYRRWCERLCSGETFSPHAIRALEAYQRASRKLQVICAMVKQRQELKLGRLIPPIMKGIEQVNTKVKALEGQCAPEHSIDLRMWTLKDQDTHQRGTCQKPSSCDDVQNDDEEPTFEQNSASTHAQAENLTSTQPAPDNPNPSSLHGPDEPAGSFFFQPSTCHLPTNTHSSPLQTSHSPPPSPIRKRPFPFPITSASRPFRALRTTFDLQRASEFSLLAPETATASDPIEDDSVDKRKTDSMDSLLDELEDSLTEE